MITSLLFLLTNNKIKLNQYTHCSTCNPISHTLKSFKIKLISIQHSNIFFNSIYYPSRTSNEKNIHIKLEPFSYNPISHNNLPNQSEIKNTTQMFETKMMILEFKELTKKAFGVTKKQQRCEINDETRVGNEKKNHSLGFSI